MSGINHTCGLCQIAAQLRPLLEVGRGLDTTHQSQNQKNQQDQP